MARHEMRTTFVFTLLYLIDFIETRSGAQTRIRTTDTRIFNPLLYQLSYLGTLAAEPAGHSDALVFVGSGWVITLKILLSSIN